MFLTPVFLLITSANDVDLIYRIIDGGKAFSYQNLSPFLMFLNCFATIETPNSPKSAPGMLGSPIIPNHKSSLSVEPYSFCKASALLTLANIYLKLFFL
jgi:hypothetical protein